MIRVPSIAIVGGDARNHLSFPDATIRAFGSQKHGSGHRRSLLDAIRFKHIDLVILLVRWLGHPERDRFVDACRKACVTYRVIPGGVSSARRAIETFIQEVWRG